MKKKLVVLLVGLASILFPFNVSAKNISTLNVSNNNNKLTVSGTTEDGVLAIAVMVYSGENLTHMETCSSNNNKFSCKLSKTFETGNYVVKVADYDGGNYVTKNINIKNNLKTEKTPETLDNVLFYISLGGISILGIAGCVLLLNKKKRLN